MAQKGSWSCRPARSRPAAPWSATKSRSILRSGTRPGVASTPAAASPAAFRRRISARYAAGEPRPVGSEDGISDILGSRVVSPGHRAPAFMRGLPGGGSCPVPDLPPPAGHPARPAGRRPARPAVDDARATRPAGVVWTVLRSDEGGSSSAQVRGRAAARRAAGSGRGGSLACRRRRRGSAGTGAGRCLDVPWLEALERSRNTRPQFDLGRIARRTNVAGAFALARPSPAARIEGRWIVLVDDVVTTGSTLVACAEVLYRAGAVAVSALTVARER